MREKRLSRVHAKQLDFRSMCRAAEGNAPAKVVTYRTSGRTFMEWDKSNVTETPPE